MSEALDEQETRRLLRWQRRIVSLFVGTWAYFLLVIAAHVVLELPSGIIQLALVPGLALVVAGGVLQFSVRCPRCRYRLGRQSGLVVPDRCRSCGVPLRSSAAEN